MDVPEPKAAKLNFGQFKDWAFLACIGLLTIMLVNSIEDLNKSVKALNEKLSEKSGELSVLRDTIKDLEDRMRAQERRR